LAGGTDDPPAVKTNESLPDLAISSISLSEVSRWTHQTMRHYDVPICFLALASSNGMYLKGRHGIEKSFVPLPSICHHGASRELPIIVANAMEVDIYRYDPLVQGPPYARFFVAAPLLMPGHRCVGTLCLMDQKPNSWFMLHHCDFLVECGKRISAHVQGRVDELMCKTMDSLGSMMLGGPDGSSGSEHGGKHITEDSLASMPQMEPGMSLTVESLASVRGRDFQREDARTVESLISIKENSEDDDEDQDARTVEGPVRIEEIGEDDAKDDACFGDQWRAAGPEQLEERPGTMSSASCEESPREGCPGGLPPGNAAP